MTPPTMLSRSAVALGLVAALSLTGCSAGAAASGDAEPAATITVKNMAYSDTEVTVQVGDTVEWVFEDGVPHDVAGDGDLEGLLQSELLTEGSYSYTFEEAGTFAYHCTPHPMMVGTVIVEG